MKSHTGFKSKKWHDMTHLERKLAIKEGQIGEEMFGSREKWRTQQESGRNTELNRRKNPGSGLLNEHISLVFTPP